MNASLRRIFVCLFLLSPWPASPTVADDVKSQEPKPLADWEGDWELHPEFNTLLGFPNAQSRLDQALDHPTSFTLSIDRTKGESLKPESLSLFQKEVFQKMRHTIVATGVWTTTFEVDPDIETTCFVTHQGGSTYLWVPAPFIVLYGGQVSYLKGIDKEHDIMVLNFYPLSKTRTHDTVGYRRKPSGSAPSP